MRSKRHEARAPGTTKSRSRQRPTHESRARHRPDRLVPRETKLARPVPESLAAAASSSHSTRDPQRLDSTPGRSVDPLPERLWLQERLGASGVEGEARSELVGLESIDPPRERNTSCRHDWSRQTAFACRCRKRRSVALSNTGLVPGARPWARTASSWRSRSRTSAVICSSSWIRRTSRWSCSSGRVRVGGAAANESVASAVDTKSVDGSAIQSEAEAEAATVPGIDRPRRQRRGPQAIGSA